MRLRWIFSFFPSCLLLPFLLCACAGGLTVSERPLQRNRHTVILFLVDGLSADLLRSELGDRLPHMRRFFLGNKTGFSLGRATFPSLTYPNIAAILTKKPMGEQPVISNHMIVGNGEINFESYRSHKLLHSLIDDQSVFHQLNLAGRESASFSYVLGTNADDHMNAGLDEGIEYKQEDFQALDGRLLENLESYLEARADPATWPDFIYVHLVGIDGYAHSHGHLSHQTRSHLQWLDGKMKKIFWLLERAEKRKQISTILTADHGFVQVSHFVDIEKAVKKIDRRIVVTNEGRFAGLHLPEQPAALEPALANLREIRGVSLTVLRQNNSLQFKARNQSLIFDYGPQLCPEQRYSLAIVASTQPVRQASNSYLCPTSFDGAVSAYPRLVANLASFLQAEHHPDALVIAGPGVSFTKGNKSNHGGLSADEMMVPLLGRNVNFAPGARTSDLLKILDQI